MGGFGCGVGGFGCGVGGFGCGVGGFGCGVGGFGCGVGGFGCGVGGFGCGVGGFGCGVGGFGCGVGGFGCGASASSMAEPSTLIISSFLFFVMPIFATVASETPLNTFIVVAVLVVIWAFVVWRRRRRFSVSSPRRCAVIAVPPRLVLLEDVTVSMVSFLVMPAGSQNSSFWKPSMDFAVMPLVSLMTSALPAMFFVAPSA